MGNFATRRRHSRKNLRCETDLTDEDRAVVAPFFLPSRLGRPICGNMGEIVSAIFHTWRRHRPAPSAARVSTEKHGVHWFPVVRAICLFEKISPALVVADRERAGRQASPSAAVIDNQSVRTIKRRDHDALMPPRRSRAENALGWSIRWAGL